MMQVLNRAAPGGAASSVANFAVPPAAWSPAKRQAAALLVRSTLGAFTPLHATYFCQKGFATMPVDTTYYDLLGVPASATPDQLRKAYHARALRVHPDKRPGDPAAADEFKRLAEAYQARLAKSGAGVVTRRLPTQLPARRLPSRWCWSKRLHNLPQLTVPGMLFANRCSVTLSAGRRTTAWAWRESGGNCGGRRLTRVYTSVSRGRAERWCPRRCSCRQLHPRRRLRSSADGHTLTLCPPLYAAASPW